VASDGFINVRRAFDASGQDKNMSFIANSMVVEIPALGQENVFSCTMDGSCKGAFPIIQAQLPWVQCFACPSHTIDGFIKNALSDTVTIRIQSNAMSNVEFTTIDWGETMFKNTYETAWQVVLSLMSHKKPRLASVNRTDTQTSKVLTMQMKMTLILTPALRVMTD
jgi:hypothetical protein